MKFLNEIDGAHQIKTDPLNRLVTDSEKISWDEKTNIPLVIGTQAATTASWTGVADTLETLVHGTTIRYWLPRASTSNTTLNLTLKGGGTTGAIPCYFNGTTRLSTQFLAGSFIMLTYLEGVLATTTSVTGWYPTSYTDTNTNTTYSEITEAEINTGTASTLRTITARRITFIINKIKQMLTKDDVGLGNVDNTSDVNKPVATITTNGIMSSVDKISLNANTAARHSHANKVVLDNFNENGAQLLYNGEVVAIETVYTWAKLKGAKTWGDLF